MAIAEYGYAKKVLRTKVSALSSLWPIAKHATIRRPIVQITTLPRTFDVYISLLVSTNEIGQARVKSMEGVEALKYR